MASLFDQPPLRDDLIGCEFLCPPVPALGHICLGFCHEVFLDQLIQAQTLNGQQGLTALDAIAQLDIDRLDLPFNPGRNLGNLLQVEGHFARSRHHFWNHVHGDLVGP
jgi:hypothetical protein